MNVTFKLLNYIFHDIADMHTYIQMHMYIGRLHGTHKWTYIRMYVCIT